MFKPRLRLSYANVASSLALFLALSTGTAYAVNEWTGANIVNDSLTGADIRESTLGMVPNADRLDGMNSTRFLQGGTAGACCWNRSNGKAYFNRVQTSIVGTESTFLIIPNFFKLTGQCYTSGTTYSELQYKPLVTGVDVWYERDDAAPAHPGPLPLNGSLQVFSDVTRRTIFQVGDGAGSMSGQRLATLTVFQGLVSGGCFFQVSAIVQTT